MKTRHVVITALVGVLLGMITGAVLWNAHETREQQKICVYESEDRWEIPDLDETPEYIKINVEGAVSAEIYYNNCDTPDEVYEITDRVDVEYLADICGGTHELYGYVDYRNLGGPSEPVVAFFDANGDEISCCTLWWIEDNICISSNLVVHFTGKKEGDVKLYSWLESREAT